MRTNLTLPDQKTAKQNIVGLRNVNTQERVTSQGGAGGSKGIKKDYMTTTSEATVELKTVKDAKKNIN